MRLLKTSHKVLKESMGSLVMSLMNSHEIFFGRGGGNEMCGRFCDVLQVAQHNATKHSC